MSEQSASLPALLGRIRAQRPLVHHITNMVVMNDTANITLAIGASPVMAHALEEVEEMVKLAGALVLNIGTLTPEQIEAMLRAGKRANELGIPMVLDPVGVGATDLRTQSALHLLRALKIAVVRGNASEVGTLVGVAAETRGVDSISLAEDPAVVASRAARTFGCTVAITGAQDVIADGERLARVENGHPLLATITGSGYMATSLVGAFLAVESDAWLAGTAGLVAIDVAGEMAAPKAAGPGTFRSHLLDTVAALEEAARFDVAIVGGNVARNEERLIIDITLLGTGKRGHPLRRSQAKPGDALMVTGTLGAAAAGLLVLKDEHLAAQIPPELLGDVRAAHRTPTAQVAAGQWLAEHGMTAGMVVSDGLVADVAHLCEASGVGVRIKAEWLPIRSKVATIATLAGRTPQELALFGEEDYELIFTVPAHRALVLAHELFVATGVKATVIGTIGEGSALTLSSQGNVSPLQARGWDHLRQSQL